MKYSKEVKGFIVIAIVSFLVTIGLVISGILGFAEVISFNEQLYTPLFFVVFGSITGIFGGVSTWLGITFNRKG